MSGACVRNGNGENISACSWLDGGDIWVEVTIVDRQDTAKRLKLTGSAAMLLGEKLRVLVENAKLMGGD